MAVSSSLVVSRRLSSSVVVCRRRRVSNSRPLGEAFASDCSWMCHVPVCAAISCDWHDHDMSRKKRDAIRCTGAACFVRSAVCCAVSLGLAFGESCFWGVGCGRAIGICVAGCGIEAQFSSLS